jgi:uncharacterized ferritin-like protein (DUF455 family)
MILNSKDLDCKLLAVDKMVYGPSPNNNILDPNCLPARSQKIQFSKKRFKFPKRGSLGSEINRARTLHFFANHELLAIEIMAFAILKFKDMPQVQKKIYSTLVDEQHHFKLYQQRMNEMGLEFGDLPINDFFWRQVPEIKTVENYAAIMSLCFEMANLDFASEYVSLFEEASDAKSSEVMEIVLNDEIKHVAFGWSHLYKQDKDVWNYFIENLPRPLTPQRSKGVKFNVEARERAGISASFIERLYAYNDDYTITNRKQWKD